MATAPTTCKRAPARNFQIKTFARALQKALADLLDEATRHTNRLIPLIQNYDDAAERQVLQEWQDRVLPKLDEAGVPIGVISRFKTFHKFDPEFHLAEGKTGQQALLEGIWDAKVKRLRAIIDSFD